MSSSDVVRVRARRWLGQRQPGFVSVFLKPPPQAVNSSALPDSVSVFSSGSCIRLCSKPGRRTSPCSSRTFQSSVKVRCFARPTLFCVLIPKSLSISRSSPPLVADANRGVLTSLGVVLFSPIIPRAPAPGRFCKVRRIAVSKRSATSAWPVELASWLLDEGPAP